jgi:hypothetical protein
MILISATGEELRPDLGSSSGAAALCPSLGFHPVLLGDTFLIQ